MKPPVLYDLASCNSGFGQYASAEKLVAEDAEENGQKELTWVTGHRLFPIAIDVSWRKPSSVLEYLFISSGHWYGAVWADWDGDGRREAVTARLNHRLGF